MELGSWSLITAPSLLALIPLIVMIVLVFRGKSNVSGMMVGIILGALMMGQDLGALAKAFSASLGSTTALIGVIIMTGAGLGVLMTETGVTHTLVYWIVKRIGVNTPTKGKLALVICSILICGLLGTLGGGNAVIAPIMLPILASLGVTPTVVATLFKGRRDRADGGPSDRRDPDHHGGDRPVLWAADASGSSSLQLLLAGGRLDRMQPGTEAHHGEGSLFRG